MKLQVLTWTPSRFAKWRECPAKVKYEDLLKTCPTCFKGRVSGGYDGEPVICDTCSKPQPEREALDRGNRLDAALTLHVAQPSSVARTHEKLSEVDAAAHSEALVEAVRHPAIAALAKKLRRTKGVTVQESIVLGPGWRAVSQYTKNAWARLKLDVLVISKTFLEIIDWKSGNIDKSKGEIREKPEYHEAMRMYQAAALSVYPQAEARVRMVFLDAPPKLDDPFRSLLTLKRKDLRDAQQMIEKKIEPMMHDTIFAPRPGYYCEWCPFSGKRHSGGPCPH